MRLIVALWTVACAETSSETSTPSSNAVTTAPVAEKQAPVRLPPWRGHGALPLLPAGSGVPPAYAAAVRSWHTATVAWSQGDALLAGEGYWEAARHLAGGDPEPIARTFAAGRCLAYENAARAYAAAGRSVEVQARLTALSDPACTHSIAGALERLEHTQE
jgi:hypothetical protein